VPNEDGLYTKDELDAEVAGLKKNQQEAMDQLKALQRKLSDLGGIDGISAKLKEFDELEAEIARIEAEGEAQDAGLTKEKLQEIENSVQARLEKKYAPLADQNKSLSEQVRTLTLDNVVKALMPKKGVRADRVDALYRVAKDNFDLTEDNAPILREDPGADIGEFIETKLAEQWPEFFEGTGSSGGGASRSAGGAGSFRRTIPAGDNDAFLANLEQIATGKVQVR